jgi:hypothetical protein
MVAQNPATGSAAITGVTGKRLRRRPSERGAAVFIVVMVIALLTGIGVFAARSVSLVDMATGYDRQATQTRLISDYAGRFVTSELGAGDAKAYLGLFAGGTDRCRSNDAALPVQVGSPLPCYVFEAPDITTLIQRRTPSQTVFADQSTSAAGSLGPEIITGNASSALEGLMRIEIIDAFSGETAAGSRPDGFMAMQFTITAYAQVRNVSGVTAWCANPNISTGASLQALRAHITIPGIAR